MKIKNKKDFILGLAGILLSIWIIYLTMQLPSAEYEGDPGPKMFPMIGGVLIGVCGIILIIKQGEPTGAFMTKAQWIDTAKFFCMYLVALGLMYTIGWTFATPIILFVLTFMLSKLSMADASIKKRLITSLIWAVLAGVCVYLIYKLGLKAKLPKGLIYNLFPKTVKKWL